MTGPGEPTELDLIPAALIAPRLRAVALVVSLFGVVVGAVVGLIASSVGVGVVVALVLAIPGLLTTVTASRRRTWLEGTMLRQRTRVRKRSIDVAKSVSVEFVVRAARVSQVVLKVSDGSHAVSVPLAMYTDTGGRELEPLGLRSLADALATADFAPAASAASALVTQLRAEARDAPLSERPLYCAVTDVKNSGRGPISTLSDSEVAALGD